MKKEIGKYLAIAIMFSLLTACAPMGPMVTIQGIEMRNIALSGNSKLGHETLAKQYENLAKEMKVKIKEQEEISKHKPQASYLGKNGQHIKSHIAYKIRRYEKAVNESLAQAVYHKQTAAKQTNRKSTAKINIHGGKINKAEINLNNKRGSL